MGMLPKEHGAYAQLFFPLATSLVVAGVTVPALLTVIAAAGSFVAHESLLILLGRRGARAAREDRRRAAIWGSLATGVAVAAGALALWLAPPEARWAFAWPLLPAAIFAAALALNREKSLVGELAAAATFASLSIPVSRAAGAPAPLAFAIALTFLALSFASTPAVRVVILKVRGGGNPAAVRTTRVVGGVAIGVIATGLIVSASRGALPWTPLLAVVPTWIVSVAVAAYPPPPTRLRRIGWLLMSGSLAASLILITTLRVL